MVISARVEAQLHQHLTHRSKWRWWAQPKHHTWPCNSHLSSGPQQFQRFQPEPSVWLGSLGLIGKEFYQGMLLVPSQLAGTPHLLKNALVLLGCCSLSLSCTRVRAAWEWLWFMKCLCPGRAEGAAPPPCSATQSRLRIHRLFPKAQTWTQTQGPGRACFDPWRGTQTVVPGIKLRSFTKIHLVLKQTVYYSQKSLISLITF